MRQHTHWRWRLDEVYVRINGEMRYLWRAVDHEGGVLDSFVTKERDKAAALKFIKKAMKRHGRPKTIVTDGLRSYGAALTEIGSKARQEVGVTSTTGLRPHTSPSMTRTRHAQVPEDDPKGGEAYTLQTFASVHGTVHNHFNQERHLVSRSICKQRRSAVLAAWRTVAG